MHEAVVTNWNAVVKPEDEVFVLGDFCLNPKWTDQIIPKLNGSIFLIPGNHDPQFAFTDRFQTKRLNQIARIKKAGVKEVHQTFHLTLKDGTKVLMSHLPYADKKGTEYDKRYMDYRPKPDDTHSVLLHGHLHCHYLKNGNMIDVGWDHQFRPWSEDEIIEMIKDSRDFIPSRITEFYKQRVDNRIQMDGL